MELAIRATLRRIQSPCIGLDLVELYDRFEHFVRARAGL